MPFRGNLYTYSAPVKDSEIIELQLSGQDAPPPVIYGLMHFVF